MLDSKYPWYGLYHLIQSYLGPILYFLKVPEKKRMIQYKPIKTVVYRNAMFALKRALISVSQYACDKIFVKDLVWIKSYP